MIKYSRVSTGSYETEYQLRAFLKNASSLEDGVPTDLFDKKYHWHTMTTGRNGKNQQYPGSQAPDDTGGFFVEKDGLVFLTEKAKLFIRI
jgi:hypothetical protein